jgi:hypothetical protein
MDNIKIYGIKGSYEYVDEDGDPHCCTWFSETFNTPVTKEAADVKVSAFIDEFKEKNSKFELDIYYSVEKDIKIEKEDDEYDFFNEMQNILSKTPYKWVKL